MSGKAKVLRNDCWDEGWMCPEGHTGIFAGNGKRGGGNCIVTFTKPPRCYCGREMEQRTSGPPIPSAGESS